MIRSPLEGVDAINQSIDDANDRSIDGKNWLLDADQSTVLMLLLVLLLLPLLVLKRNASIAAIDAIDAINRSTIRIIPIDRRSKSFHYNRRSESLLLLLLLLLIDPLLFLLICCWSQIISASIRTIDNARRSTNNPPDQSVSLLLFRYCRWCRNQRLLI